MIKRLYTDEKKEEETGVEEIVVWDIASYEKRNKESNEGESVCDGKLGDLGQVLTVKAP